MDDVKTGGSDEPDIRADRFGIDYTSISWAFSRCMSCQHWEGSLQCPASDGMVPMEVLYNEFDYQREHPSECMIWPPGRDGEARVLLSEAITPSSTCWTTVLVT